MRRSIRSTPTTSASCEVAFRFRTEILGPRPEFNFQTTPLMVERRPLSHRRHPARGRCARRGHRRTAVDAQRARRQARRSGAATAVGRGLAYWSDGKRGADHLRHARLPDGRARCQDGRPRPDFGNDGIVDLKLDNDQDMDLMTGEIGLHAAPVIAKDIIVIGAAHVEGVAPKSKTQREGLRPRLRRAHRQAAVDLPHHSATRRIRQRHVGGDSWSYTGNAGVWAQMTVDEELGIGLHAGRVADRRLLWRPSARQHTLFGESLVALDLKTGKRKWHYQLVHHGIWDFDIPCAPILTDITVDGKPIKAVAQPTKQGWVYVFDRVTGKPVWPIEERPVEKGDVPGEAVLADAAVCDQAAGVRASRAFDRRPDRLHAGAARRSDEGRVALQDRSDLHAARGQQVGRAARHVDAAEQHRRRELARRSVRSGNENPLHVLQRQPERTRSGAAGFKRSDMRYVQGVRPIPMRRRRMRDAAARRAAPVRPPARRCRCGGGGASPLNVQGLPLVKPPYGRITAIDLNKGEIVWQIAHGDTPDNIRNHPALKGVTIPRTGRTGRIGTLVTKTLLIAGEGGFNTLPSGQRGALLRAYDKATGADVGAVPMPAPQTGSPMTYMVNGKQYIAVAIGGTGYPAELLVFKAPDATK